MATDSIPGMKGVFQMSPASQESIKWVGPLKEVGWGSEREGWPWSRETGAEFEGRLCRNPIEHPPKRAEGNYREGDSQG